MFKKLIENMIATAVENEFSSYFVSNKDIHFINECSDQFEIYFSIDTPFINCQLTGSISTLGTVQFIKNESYKTMLAFYNK